MRIAGLLHTLDVHGGVRRYFEIGNAVVRAGHEFILYHKTVHDKKPWMEFLGELRPYHEHRSVSTDVMFTGAYECFLDLEKARADTKIVFVVAKFYAQEYLKLWQRAGKSLFWVGVAKDWNLGMEEIQGITIPCGINTTFFKSVERPPAGRLKVSFYARTGEGRNVEQVVQVAEKLHKKIDFVGYDAPGYPSICSDCVESRTINSQEELRSLLQSSDIIVSAMRSAGWNNIIAEGMACGAVPVTTPAGVGDLVVDGKTGLLCDPGNLVESLASNITALYCCTEEMVKIRRAAIEHVKQFSWDSAVSKLMEAVQAGRS